MRMLSAIVRRDPLLNWIRWVKGFHGFHRLSVFRKAWAHWEALAFSQQATMSSFNEEASLFVVLQES